ncbi:uncharacterized protein [Aegilops tauschii subsp. strangulata]|nr:uncharacterized protein LOC109773544 [Aegilops tauschii subsp. strangulata]
MAPPKNRCRSGWPDLPPDLLGVVLHRLPSLVDRVRLRALPWILFGDGTLLDAANSCAHRVRLPDDAAGCYSAGENMLFVMHHDGRCSLMDAFSGAMTPHPELAALLRYYKVDPHDGMYRRSIEKVVVSAPSAALPVIAVLTSDCRVIVSTRRPGGEVNSCLELLGFELGNGSPRKPTPAGARPDVVGGVPLIEGSRAHDSHDSSRYIRYRIQKRFPDSVARLYLVESDGKLLMVRRWVRWDAPESMARRRVRSAADGPGGYRRMERTQRLDVFEAELGDGRPRVGRWKKVYGLGGRAIFVCARCSKSAPAGDGAREDCVYFLRRQYLGRKPGDGSLGDSGVFDMRRKTITALLPESSVPAPLPG